MLDRRRDPELQQVHGIFLRSIVFGVAHSSPRTHPLNFARADDAYVAHVIAMFDGAFDDVSDDFHLTMRVKGKSAGGSHYVVVKNAQWSKTHVGRVVVMVEREMPVRVKPICFSVIALI